MYINANSFLTPAHPEMVCLLRNGISHFVVYHETGQGLFSYTTKGRPSKEVTKKRLETPHLIEEEIAELRKSLKLPNENGFFTAFTSWHLLHYTAKRLAHEIVSRYVMKITPSMDLSRIASRLSRHLEKVF